MAKLLVQESAGVREFELVDQEVHIGRELDNALRIADPSISRHHCVVRRITAGYEIADLQSSNGVLVNGNRTQSSLIKDGDRITLGQIQMTFSDPEYASATVAIPAGDPMPAGTVRMSSQDVARVQALPAPPRTEPVKTPEPTFAPPPPAFAPPPPPAFAPPPAPAFGTAAPPPPPTFGAPPPPPPPPPVLGAAPGAYDPGRPAMDGAAGTPPPPPDYGHYPDEGDYPMANTISKPDANPILAAILTWFVFGCGHMVINGQQRKWIYTLVATFVGCILCVLPGMVIGILSVVDAYQTAERLASGEAIPENEYSQALLFKIISMVDKEATCSRA